MSKRKEDAIDLFCIGSLFGGFLTGAIVVCILAALTTNTATKNTELCKSYLEDGYQLELPSGARVNDLFPSNLISKSSIIAVDDENKLIYIVD